MASGGPIIEARELRRTCQTTTIKMLITLLLPTSGSGHVLGLDVVKNAKEVRERIGYVFGSDRGLYERLSARDNLRYFAELYGVSGKAQRPSASRGAALCSTRTKR